MTTPALSDAEREQQLNTALLSVVEAVEKGNLIDRRQFLATYPEFATELDEFLAGRDHLERLASPSCASSARGMGTAGNPPDSQKAQRESSALSPPGREAGSTDKNVATAELGELGDFRLRREVGRGGMGVVYEAVQISLNRRVALKVLPFAAALDSRQLERFKNEAQAAALLHHPNIVPVHAVGCDRGVHYYAMQYIEGQSLAALLQELRQTSDGKPSGPAAQAELSEKQGPEKEEPTPAPAPPGTWEMSTAIAGETARHSTLSISAERLGRKSHYFRRIAEIGVKAAEALEHAHQLGVIHRDVKPANLLLDERRNLWITDFGLALLQSNVGVTTTGEMVGTLRYMSPEQTVAKRGLVDHRTDIYSLGVTLYELLTLKPLFEGSDAHQLLRQIADEEPRTPRAIDRSIPVELETIVLKAIAKSPADRYATAQELADDLRRCLENQPVHARRPSILDRAAKWSRRHKPVVVSAVVLLSVAAVSWPVSTMLIAQAYKRELQKAEEAQEERNRAEASFLQARRAVDFLTQVSAEELVDKADVLEVRRKLLEGALQYYEEFIDQHLSNPAIEAELAASRARVAQILADLEAQQDYYRLMQLSVLMAETGVQADLKVTPGQKANIAELAGKIAEQRREAFPEMRRLSEEERGKKFKELAPANDRAMAKVLTSEQIIRLKQIALQQRGPQAFGEPDVAEALLLTREQKTSIRALQDKSRHAIWETFRSSKDPAESRQKAQQVWKATRETIFAALTPEQQATWKGMTGPTFQGWQSSPYGHGFPRSRQRPPNPGPPLR